MQANAAASAAESVRRPPRVVIVGAGMSGLLMGIRLKQAGIESFEILEKAERIGGTWRDNTYPGVACDIPSHLYTYSFEPNPHWSHWFSPGSEIQRYFEHVAKKYGLMPHIHFGRETTAARFGDGVWRVRCADGSTTEGDILVTATGVLHQPNIPAIPGLEDFAGACFHSARWDHDAELDGKRIGVIGTGSTATQITSALVDRAARFTLFQRTPQWIFPMPNPQHSGALRGILSRFPGLARVLFETLRVTFQKTFARAPIGDNVQHRVLAAIARRNLRRSVRDPELRARLTPDYEPFCKRLVFSPDFYEKIQRPNAELATTAIERIEPEGVRTRDGRLHELDVLVLATGFKAHEYVRPMQVINEAGRSLDQAWADGAQAHRTVAMPGFPNYFMLVGPYTPIGNFPVTATSELQVDYVMQFVRRFARGECDRVEPKPAALTEFNAAVRDGMEGTIWVTGGCQSWYLGPQGRPTMWPWTFERFRRDLREPNWDEYVLS